MAWSGPDQRNQCKMTDLSKLPEHSYGYDDENIKNTPQGMGLRGFERIGRRPQEAIAGEIEDEDEADRMDEQTESMRKYRDEWGGYGGGMKPPHGENF